MNTMKDLKNLVHEKMYETIDGRTVDQYMKGKVEMPHMLGITPIGETWTYEDYEDTILDPSHEFWDSYVEEVNTIGAAEDAVEEAILILHKSEVMEVIYPRGEEAGVVYVELDKP